MEFLTVKQAAALWGISTRRITLLCEQGRISGAVKAGRMWILPHRTQKPFDLRHKRSDKDCEEDCEHFANIH